MARAALLERLTRGPVITWRTAIVRDVVLETPSARTLVFDVPEWPGHEPGQHVDVRLTAEDGYSTQRSYSIASPPEAGTVALTVEEIVDGEVSPYLVEEVRAGDELELRGPIGGYFTWTVARGGPVLLVGGGSGLVPLMSMLRHRAVQRSPVEVNVLVSARDPERALWRDELAALEPREGLRVTETFTRSAPEGWTGFARRVDAEMLAAAGPPPGTGARTFVCGPTAFVEAVTTLLVEAGHPAGDIHAERFGGTGGRDG